MGVRLNVVLERAFQVSDVSLFQVNDGKLKPQVLKRTGLMRLLSPRCPTIWLLIQSTHLPGAEQILLATQFESYRRLPIP